MKRFKLLIFLCTAGISLYAQQPALPAFPIPTEEEMQEAFKQLMNMSEEERRQLEIEAMNQLASLDPETLKQIEAEMLNRVAALTPEQRDELEKRGEDMLRELGIDPKTGLPIEPEIPVSSPGSVTPPAPAPITKPAIVTFTKEYIRDVLTNVIQYLKQLRLTATSDQEKNTPLGNTVLDLDQLIRTLTVINKPEDYERLLNKEYEPIIRALEQLYGTLQSNELCLSAKEALDCALIENDPYDILSIPYTATTKEIETAYQRLMEKNDPSKVRARLAAQGANERDLEKAEREARINLNLINDAYEALSNAQSRAQLDRERKARQQHQKSSTQEAHASFVRNIDAFNMAINQQKVLQKLNDFLQKYEPEKLAQLKALREEEEKRKKEADALARTRPGRTPPAPVTPPGKGSSSERDRYGRDGGYDYDRGGYQPYQPGWQGNQKPRPPAKPEDKGGTDKAKPKLKDEKKDEKKEDKGKDKEKTPPIKEPVKPEEPAKPDNLHVQATGKLFNAVYDSTRELNAPDIRQTAEEITSTKDLLRETDVIQKQQQLLSRYAENIKKLQDALAATKNPAERQIYQESWNSLKTDPSYKQAEQLVNKITMVLGKYETDEAASLITKSQSERLVNLVNTVNTIQQDTARINKLVEPSKKS